MTGIASLSNKNLLGQLGKTAGLTCIVLAVSFALLTGSIISESLGNGERNVEERLGADLMAVPAGSGYAQESILINGTASTFYMPATLEAEIASIDGVARASSQFYMTSVSDAECCEFLVELIAYDPATDFTVTPWIAESYSSEVGTDQLVVGANINVTDGTIRLFDHEFEVVAKLAGSGTGMDNTVFMTKETIGHMATYAAALGFPVPGDVNTQVSVILVDVDPEYTVYHVSNRIQSAGSGSDVDVVSSADVTSQITLQMGSLIGYVTVFEYTLVLMAFIILALLFSITVNARKKEFATLRMIGATRGQVASMVIYESAVIGAIGAVAGVFLSLAIILPFSGVIGGAIGMPYIAPSIGALLPSILSALLIAFAIGPVSAAWTAYRLSKNDAYALFREGE